MTAIGTLFQTVLMLGIVLTGLAYIVNPSAGKEIAKRTGTVALAVFAADQALAYLWSSGIGALLLIATILFVIAKIRATGKG